MLPGAACKVGTSVISVWWNTMRDFASFASFGFDERRYAATLPGAACKVGTSVISVWWNTMRDFASFASFGFDERRYAATLPRARRGV